MAPAYPVHSQLVKLTVPAPEKRGIDQAGADSVDADIAGGVVDRHLAHELQQGALSAQYAAYLGNPTTLEIEPVATMTPARRSIIDGNARRDIRKRDFAFASITWSHSSSLVS